MSNDPLMLSALPKVSGGELKQLQKRCMQLMQQDDEPTKFPGAQPVSFERRHLAPQEPGGRHQPSLVADPYFAAEKTDGVRYMLLIMGERGAFMVDRNFEMKRLPPSMRFPSYATEGSNPRLADPRQVYYSHVRVSPWTGARPARRP